MLSGASIFITGGAGFIGSTLAGLLVDSNEVTLYDNFSRDAITGSRLEHHPNLRIVRGDILDPELLRRSIDGHSHVVHCAAIAGIDTVTRNPVTTMRVNMIGSAHVLEASNGLDTCERVVCFSTSEVFGRRAFQVSETSDTVMGAVGEPRWTYAVSKLAEEHLAIAYFQEFGLPTTVVRPFNVYGAGQVGEGAIRNFLTKALRDEPIEIYGDGSQIRAWCHVDDMVRFVLLALEHPAAVGESFNVGNVTAVETTSGLADRIVRLTDSASTISFVERDGVDVELRVPAVGKARTMLGFEASVGLDEGIRRTASWMRERIGA